MKKIILPLVAMGLSFCTMAQAESASNNSFTFINGTNKPVLVFVYGEKDTSMSQGTYISPFLFKNIILPFSGKYSVQACWSTSKLFDKDPNCLPNFVQGFCSLTSPQLVRATGFSQFANGPDLKCAKFGNL